MQFLLKSIKLVDFQWQNKLTDLFQCMWRKEAIPQYFKDASIIHLYKRKGNPQVCDNDRGISLINCLEDTGKNSIEPPECAS